MAMSEWKAFTLGNIHLERTQGAVYEFGEAHAIPYVIYIGSSVNVRDRLAQHYNGTGDPCVKRNATHYRVEYTPFYRQQEKTRFDAHVRTYGRPPKCNDAVPSGR